MDFKVHQFLPNPGYITYKLSNEEIDFVWKKIDQALVDNENANAKLAGNINKSLDMNMDNIGPFNTKILALCEEYEKQFGKTYKNQVSVDKRNEIVFNAWWVNYQFENEFNPQHNHSGIYSWVIWMNIPTESDDQKNLPIAANSGSDARISNFEFTYTNTLGGIKEHIINMGKAAEGTLCLFPADLKHSVNPFYNCSEPRITVAGNISLYTYPKNN
jgi:hypothetical protein